MVHPLKNIAIVKQRNRKAIEITILLLNIHIFFIFVADKLLDEVDSLLILHNRSCEIVVIVSYDLVVEGEDLHVGKRIVLKYLLWGQLFEFALLQIC